MATPDTASAQATSSSPPSGHLTSVTGRARLWCRKCEQPVTVTGDPWIGKAVHTTTDAETGPDGHLAAPINLDPALRKEALAIEAEFEGAFDVSAQFGFFRGDWANLPPGAVAVHYESDNADGLRLQLRVALSMAGRP
jgi:hypothetical protein